MKVESVRSSRVVLRATRIAVVLAIFAGGLTLGVFQGARIQGWLGLRGHEAMGNAPAESGRLWTCGMHPQVIQDRPGTCPICGMALTPVNGSGTAKQAPRGERKVRYWWDPMMNPPYISDRPGKSPMGMDMVPVYEDEVSAGSALVIDPAVVQNMGLRLAKVEEAALTRTIRAVGVLAEPEPARHDVNLRVGGWIHRLHAATEGMRLAKGDPLFDLYSPELQVAVEELIGARKLRETLATERETRAIYDSASRKLELFGLEPAQVEALAALETAPRTVTFHSPADGYLAEKTVYAGSAVGAGDTVMRIADASKLWVDSRVFEKDLPHVELGQVVTARVDGRPGQTFDGRVILVHPRIDPTTRTALVRTEVDNTGLALRHGMFATVFLEVEIAPKTLVVPREAIIDTGTRQVAFVALERGHFEPRKVEMGASGDGGMVQVLSGLAPGEQVVASGQFLLDAESRMKEAIQRFLQEKAQAAGEQPRELVGTPAGVLRDTSDAWLRSAEDFLSAYLDVGRVLGAPQEREEVVDAGPLSSAASALREAARGADQTRIADGLAASVSRMAARPIADQRKLFADVSQAAIELAERSPRTGERAPLLFVVHCPMVNGRWLQASETVANPYYATTMKSCGEIERRVPIPERAEAAPASEHEGGHR